MLKLLLVIAKLVSVLRFDGYSTNNDLVEFLLSKLEENGWAIKRRWTGGVPPANTLLSNLLRTAQLTACESLLASNQLGPETTIETELHAEVESRVYVDDAASRTNSGQSWSKFFKK